MAVPVGVKSKAFECNAEITTWYLVYRSSFIKIAVVRIHELGKGRS